MNEKKHLRSSSIIVLIFAAVSFLNIISQLIWGDFDNVPIPDGSPENILLISKIVIAVISLIILAPQIYIGLKGLKMAKKPDASKAHINWAMVLFVLSILALVSPIMNIISGQNISDNVFEFLSLLVEVFIFFDYIKYAKAVSKGI